MDRRSGRREEVLFDSFSLVRLLLGRILLENIICLGFWCFWFFINRLIYIVDSIKINIKLLSLYKKVDIFFELNFICFMLC